MIEDRFTVIAPEGEVTYQAENFDRDNFSTTLLTNLHAIYVGLYKPFSSFFIAFETANTATTIDLEFAYFDKPTNQWVDLEVKDDTQKLTRDGFIKWDLPVDENNNSKWGTQFIGEKTKYYFRIKPAVGSDPSSAMEIKGINVLFSDDNDLVEERQNIVEKHSPSSGTWLIKHQASRKLIMQKLRNRGNRKYQLAENTDTGISRFKDITAFDLLEINQIRQAAKFYTLANIYIQELSDLPGDKWEQLGREFEAKGDESLNVFYLSVDVDDDGELDSHEEAANTALQIRRT